MARWLWISLFVIFTTLSGNEPRAVYLSWIRDPTTTITVNWITEHSKQRAPLFYRKENEEAWKSGESGEIPLLDLPYYLHRATLEDLTPNTRYQFKIGNDSSIYKFDTLPKNLETPLSFIVGGDLYNGKKNRFQKMAAVAAPLNPRFALLGGDIAYAHQKNQEKENFSNKQVRWIEFLIHWTTEMVTTDGCLIPLIPCIGNHDVVGHFHQKPTASPYFYLLFPSPSLPGYQSFTFGNWMRLFILDTNHTTPVAGAQTKWLEEELLLGQHIPYRFALYHVPAFPATKKYYKKKENTARKHWVPLFEKYNLTAAFENHEHCYKRTRELSGIVYIGDGGWGVKNMREPFASSELWYLAETALYPHFLFVTLSPEDCLIEAINDEGGIFDQVRRKPLQ